MAMVDEDVVLRALDRLHRCVVALVRQGALDADDIELLLGGATEALYDGGISSLHLKLEQIAEEAARVAAEPDATAARARRGNTSDV